MEITPEIKEKLELLHQKYDAMGQDLLSYLDGLLYSDVTTYWDYIETDTLLSLQRPKTPIPDELIFIIYHQITELYFKLSLHELKQISNELLPVDKFTMKMSRVNRYFEALTKSFEIMIQGMEQEQFLKFRMALLPASGFQSAQYRMIEFYATDLIELTDKNVREELRAQNADTATLFSHIYWKHGATELATGKKTLTLLMFEHKYRETFIDLADSLKTSNIWRRYQQLNEADRANEALVNELKEFDLNVNVRWPMVHMKSAARYLKKDPEDIAATGGTNWQKYLPPRFQRRIFFPTLWPDETLDNWGKEPGTPT